MIWLPGSLLTAPALLLAGAAASVHCVAMCGALSAHQTRAAAVGLPLGLLQFWLSRRLFNGAGAHPNRNDGGAGLATDWRRLWIALAVFANVSASDWRWLIAAIVVQINKSRYSILKHAIERQRVGLLR